MRPETVSRDRSPGVPPPHGRPASGLTALRAGAAFGIAALGAVLASAGIASPLRAPCTLFLLLGAPAPAIGAALGGLDPLGRAVVAVAGAAAVNLLVAGTMLALDAWSVRGGVITVAALSGAGLLLTSVRSRAGRAGGGAAGRVR
ncbi:hypothetical protein ACIRPT_28735 [Streptomyces sp. NPDC101227]|uniref:hypothetical protein n=1 Tax=Streptomyces sp. NPDC101227 TaxID=3366136 RepID=UPI0037FB9176